MSNLPIVGGRSINRSIADFERGCLVLIEEEQNKASPNNALISILCDAVRLSREYVDLAIKL